MKRLEDHPKLRHANKITHGDPAGEFKPMLHEETGRKGRGRRFEAVTAAAPFNQNSIPLKGGTFNCY